ncbi:MAG TPA: serine hydrolase [Gemmatimonadaceae bacterium]|nr:serine hydrolase [Gemmatimonadaceae bacterium]
MRILRLACAAALAAAPLAAQPAQRAALAGRFRDELAALARQTSGVLGVAAVDLVTGERFGVNDTLQFPQGSAIKVPILLELLRQSEAGQLRLDERVTLRAADQVGGDGVLRFFADGASSLALRDLATLMVVLSDNTATNVLIDRVGMERVNATVAALGAAHTRLQRKMIRPAESARGQENLSTPAEAADIMARVARCQLPVSAAGCAELRRLLELPKPAPKPFRDALPAALRVAWKPGDVEGVATAWALVDLPGRPYAVAAMVSYGADDPEAALGPAARAVHAYFSQLARSTPFGARVPAEMLGKP